MIILCGFYNAEKYIIQSLKSIKYQTYKDFTCYITHDLSTDGSVELVKDYIKGDDRFILVSDNDKKLYQTGNFDTTIRHNPNIADGDVCIEVDGDDWLPDDGVFQRIHDVYMNKDIWIANGSFRYSSGHIGFAKKQENFDSLRTGRFTASHIRTWRAFLWRAINDDDLKDEKNDYWQWSGDVCFMFPMLEMAGPEHYHFMTDINYVYNEGNPINEHKVDMSMVTNHATRIRQLPKYNRLER
jgi:glycosyltransferase involved in cell wall biosynthesis